MAFNPREFFMAFATAMNERDYETLGRLLHPDFVAFMPQSGEQSRGVEGFKLQSEAYPGGVPDMPQLPDVKFVGDDELWAITPSFTVVPLATPNEFTIISRVTYPDGVAWHSIVMVELRDELLYRTEFFFAPELRAPLAESIARYSRG
jgi:hypothetical protein